MNNIVLGLDLDGVLYPFHEALYTHYQYEMDYKGSYTDFWTIAWNEFSIEKQDYLVSLPILYEMILPTPQVRNFLDFASVNADIYYITSRHPDLERVTKRYIANNNFPLPGNLIMTKDKVTTCRMMGVTHFLDDYASQVKKVSGVADAYLMAKPWNKDYQEELRTVHNLSEFKEKVFV